MRYARSKIEQDFEEHAYRIYISDGLYSLAGNYKDRYVNMIDLEATRKRLEQESKTGDQLAQEVMEAAGLKFSQD